MSLRGAEGDAAIWFGDCRGRLGSLAMTDKQSLTTHSSRLSPIFVSQLFGTAHVGLQRFRDADIAVFLLIILHHCHQGASDGQT